MAAMFLGQMISVTPAFYVLREPIQNITVLKHTIEPTFYWTLFHL